MARTCRVYHTGPAWSDPLHGASTLMSELHQERAQKRVQKAERRQKGTSSQKPKKARKDQKT